MISTTTVLSSNTYEAYEFTVYEFTVYEFTPHHTHLPKATASAVGRAAAATFGERCTDEFALLMYMAMGRRDTSHPFYPYLASLPKEVRPAWSNNTTATAHNALAT